MKISIDYIQSHIGDIFTEIVEDSDPNDLSEDDISYLGEKLTSLIDKLRKEKRDE